MTLRLFRLSEKAFNVFNDQRKICYFCLFRLDLHEGVFQDFYQNIL